MTTFRELFKESVFFKEFKQKISVGKPVYVTYAMTGTIQTICPVVIEVKMKI